MLDESEDVPHRALEAFFVHRVFANREMSDDVGQVSRYPS